MKSGTQTLPDFPLKGEVVDQPKDLPGRGSSQVSD